MHGDKEVIKMMQLVLANSYGLYLKTQNYHWNVTGPQFESLHILFEKQYSDLAESVDEIAERIRALGSKAPASFSLFNELKTLADGNEDASAEEMVKGLAEDNLYMASLLKEVIVLAQQHQDEATADLCIKHIEIHEKNAWMLHSSI